VHWDPVPIHFVEIKADSLPKILDTSPVIRVTSPEKMTPKIYNKLPYCTRGDHPGRWVKLKAVTQSLSYKEPYLDFSSAQTSFQPPIDFMTHYQDRLGHIWLPFDCKYRSLSYTQFKHCLAHNNQEVLHFWGDSNVRRALKALSTNGAWCNTWYDPASPECNCYDWNFGVPQMDPHYPVNKLYSLGGLRNTSVFFYTWQGLLPYGPNWKYDMEKERLQDLLKDFSNDSRKNMSRPSALILSMSGSLCLYDEQI
jgi:hypothetical protein